ncbi:MAG: GNAT family N-acetyltransferase [Candidatus Omnitrophica bacterium]|nr:GNAT family N-acetyltransferase [Candidatus Omnitrophota bacterium]
MARFTYKILDSIKEIGRPEWDLVFGDIAEGYGFFKTLEESSLKEYSFCYVLIYGAGSPLLIAPLFTADFNLDIAATGPIQRLTRIIRKFIPRFFTIKTLFCGSPIGENGILGLKISDEDKPGLVLELIRIMENICAEKDIPFIVFKDFLAKDLDIFASVKTKGFFTAETFPAVTLELPFNSLQDYLRSLSHNSRKDLRRKIKKSKARADIRVEVADNIADIIEDVYGLYLNTYAAGNVKFEKLTKEFFINISRNLAMETKFFLYYVGHKLAAFNLCFVHKDTLIDKFIGFDYDVAYKYNLYFFSWCYNIEWCLKNSIRYYRVGQTDYHPKIRLGGRPIPLYACARHNNHMLNLLMLCLARLLAPHNFDENIKHG